MLVWIARVFVCFIVVGLLGLIATENKDVTKNKDAVYNEIEPLTSSLPTGVVSTTTHHHHLYQNQQVSTPPSNSGVISDHC